MMLQDPRAVFNLLFNLHAAIRLEQKPERYLDELESLMSELSAWLDKERGAS